MDLGYNAHFYVPLLVENWDEWEGHGQDGEGKMISVIGCKKCCYKM
jgi:hypothetical protein